MMSEGAMSYLLKKLDEQDNFLSREMFASVARRLNGRRNKKLISNLIFLHSGDFPNDNRYLKYDSKKTIKQTIIDLSERLFPNLKKPVENLIPDVANPYRELDLIEVPEKDELEEAIDLIKSSSNAKCSGIENEMKHLIATKTRLEKLDLLYNALKTVQATSTVVERVFSVAGNMKTKVRNKISPENLNILVYLK